MQIKLHLELNAEFTFRVFYASHFTVQGVFTSWIVMLITLRSVLCFGMCDGGATICAESGERLLEQSNSMGKLSYDEVR